MYKLRFWVGNGMLPVKYLAPNILMPVNYWVYQIAQGLGWTAPEYLKKEGATFHPGKRMHCLLDEGRPAWRFDMRVET